MKGFGLLIGALIGINVASAQSSSDVKFDRITMQDGLSNNQINCIYQDQQGFIWIGTLSGLNRYDGYKIKTFYYKQGAQSSLKDNTVIDIAQGPDGKIWLKHGVEISAYDASTNSFSTPSRYLELLQTDPVFITQVFQDQMGNHWFAIVNRGLVKITKEGNVIEVNTSKEADIHIASNNVTDLTTDAKGNLWITHSSGIFEVLSYEENEVIRKYGIPEMLEHEGSWNLFLDRDMDVWLYSPDDPFGLFYLNTRTGASRILGREVLSSELIRGVVQHQNGEIWIGADHGGISIIDKKTWKVSNVKSDPNLPSSLVNNNVNVLFQDRDGGIWVGTTKSGVSYNHRRANSFSHVKVNRKDPAFNDLSSFAEDKDGYLWIGTNGKSLLRYDRKAHEFVSVLEDKGFTGPKPSVVVSLLYDHDGRLWVGSYLEGLFLLDLESKRFSKINFSERDSDLGSSIWELYQDSEGFIWIGTLNRGVFRYNTSTGEVENYDQGNVLNSNYVTCITEDGQGRIWVGTGAGLTMIDVKSNDVRTYLSNDSIANPLSSNSVISLLTDAKGGILVGTLDGLNVFDPETGGFRVIRRADGLSSNIIMSILEDESGSLWVSTSQGMSKMTEADDHFDFQNFDISDGLQAENFTEDASFKTADGTLIFAGQNGFNAFKPCDIILGEHTPQILLTQFSLANSSIVPGEVVNDRVLLERPLEKTEDIYLNYDENSFSFEFVALSYFQANKIRYQYMLEGLEDQWLSASSDMRQVNYSNLNYGDYTFHVRISNNPNSWTDEGISIRVHIRPPFWQTGWAFAFYILATLVLLYATRAYVVNRERKKASVENERKEVERQHQLDLMKIKFFTNISHEFRTPLSLVLTPIERMIQKPDQIKLEELTLVQRNAKRLMNLVNQLLDFRKMEANQHTLSQSNGNLVDFLQDITDSFSDLSREQNIELSFISGVKNYYTFFDKDKMEKIMLNLLSNAFKFTLPGGGIRVDFDVREKDERNVLIMVTDTGIGIPEDKKELIFNRFFQNELKGDLINNGTGIGLSITKEFVELHGGTVSVDSKPDVGSTFIVELPLKQNGSDQDLTDELVQELSKPANQEVRTEIDVSLPTVLLVEDHFDFRFYLKDNLRQYYNVDVASNGKVAWKMMMHKIPDIVISDVMMPVMDGYELCEKMKSDPRTLHIPVILLTAQSSDQHRIQGLEAGAIEYISKPFNFEILISSVNSALKFQKRVQESGNKIKANPSEVDIVSMDEKLVTRAVELIELNMSNSEFSVEDLSHELGYSRGHFYQKILKISGQTPIDFIRNIRMKRAAELLKKSQLNVAEVAYKVGYNNPKLFSRYFKSQYKVYPSEYRVQVKKENTAL